MFGLPLAERDQSIVWKDAILSLVDAGGADMSEEGMAHAMAMSTISPNWSRVVGGARVRTS